MAKAGRSWKAVFLRSADSLVKSWVELGGEPTTETITKNEHSEESCDEVQ